MKTLAERFWAKVDKTPGLGPRGECWEWRGATAKGYGKIGSRRGKAPLTASRVAFYLEHGRWPEGNACHSCDNTLCVRHSHIFEGSQHVNVLDAVRKGRMASGPRHYKSKLSAEDVREIRWLAAMGARQCDIAKQFNLSAPTTSMIVRGLTYRSAA